MSRVDWAITVLIGCVITAVSLTLGPWALAAGALGSGTYLAWVLWRNRRGGGFAVSYKKPEYFPEEWRARIMEVEVKILNRTSRRKTLTRLGFEYGGSNQPATQWTPDEMRRYHQHVEARKRAKMNLIENHALIEPHRAVKGWSIHVLPWNAGELTRLAALDENQVEYEGKLRRWL